MAKTPDSKKDKLRDTVDKGVMSALASLENKNYGEVKATLLTVLVTVRGSD